MSKRQEPENPWEQQPGESAKAFEAFAAYRDMGADRSIRKVAQKVGKSATQMGKWSKAHQWTDRVRAYDKHLDHVAQAQAEREVQRMTTRHINIAMNLQAKAIDALNNLDPSMLSPKMMLAFLTKATEIERANRLGAARFGKDGKREDSSSEVEVIIEGDEDADNHS